MARQPAVARCGLQGAPSQAANTAIECLYNGLYWQQGRFREEKTTDGHKEMMSQLGSPLLKVIWAGTVFKRSLFPMKPPPASGMGYL